MTRTQELIAKYEQKPGLRGKIIAKCIECIHDPLDKGTWRQQTEACTCQTCPLYPVRPKSASVKIATDTNI